MGEDEEANGMSTEMEERPESRDASFSAKDLRLDRLITFHYEQIERNADILKDDLETIRKRCMVPDLPKLIKENKESHRLAKSILNQFDGAIHKYIDIMSKLGVELRAQMLERFPEHSPSCSGANPAGITASSPPSSTTAEVEGENEKCDDISPHEGTPEKDQPINVSEGDAVLMDTTESSVAELFPTPPAHDKSDTENQEAVTGNYDSDASSMSSRTVLVPKVEEVKKSTSKGKKPKASKEASPADDLLDVTMRRRSSRKTSLVTGNENKAVGESKSSSEADTNDIPATSTITDLETDVPAPDLDIPELLKCPKLAQITKVAIRKLSDEIVQKFEQNGSNGHRHTASSLDDLEQELSTLIDGNHFKKTVSQKKSESTRTLPPRRAKEKTKVAEHVSDNEMSEADNSSSGSDIELASSNAKVAITDDSKLDSDDSDQMDLDVEEPETGNKKAKDKDKTPKEKRSDKKSSKRYITPKLKLLLTSDSEDEGGKKSKAKKDKSESNEKEDSEKKKTSKGSGSGSEVVGSEEEDTKFSKKTKKTKKTSDSDVESVKSSDSSKIKKEKDIKKSVSDSDDDSDFLPMPKKKVINTNMLKKRIIDLCETESDDSEANSKDKDSRKKRGRSSSQSDSSSKNKKTKKRRRIKTEATSESTDSDVVILDSKKRASPVKPDNRVGMRKVMSKKELLKTTRQAGKEEEDRKKRVAETQKLYNEFLTAQTEKGDSLTELVLEFDKQSKKPLLSVETAIVKNLKPHQVSGIKFMWENCYESIEETQKDENGGNGCILAHCMGLGKTLQTIAFLHTVMSSDACKTKRALVICPLNTVGNWFSEFQHWCSDCDISPRLHRLWEPKGKRRFEALSDWQRMGGVGIIHYESFRLLASINEKKKGRPSPRELQIVKSSLLDPGPDIVVCDEGHLLKNASSKQAQSVLKIRTPRRVVLTGTPLQNNLMEYYTMMSFVKPNLLGTKKEFRNRFLNPMEKGQHQNSDEFYVRLMKKRAHVLHKLLDGCVQRLDYSVLMPYLPPKFEYAISINLSQIQKDLYDYYLKNVSTNSKGDKLRSTQMLCDYMTLVKVWTHPIVLTYKRRGQVNTDDDSEANSLDDFICDDETTDSDKPRKGSTAESDIEVIDETKNGKSTEEEEEAPVSPNWYSSILKSQENLEISELSGKIVVVMEILKTCAKIGDKVLVFSQFLTSLDLIEEFLAQMDQKVVEDEGNDEMANQTRLRWRPNIEYFRIDGSVKTDDRHRSCKIFNKDSATRAKLFLISTKAGSLGINLTGANRVIMFDASWNPSHDIQGIFRVYRFGQTKPCYIYRLLARGTMEEKIYNRQVVKLSLSCRVVDEQQIERHFQYEDVQEMYNFNPNDKTERPIPAVPKDRLFADLLISQKDWIFSYLEHDSLLENKEEEELTEEERRTAWEEYENEDKPKPNPHSDEWSNRISALLAEKYPEKNQIEIFQITYDVRNKFNLMERLLFIINAPGTDNTVKEYYKTQLTDIATGLKAVFGDETNWTELFNRVGTSSQPRVVPPRPNYQINRQPSTSVAGSSGSAIRYQLPNYGGPIGNAAAAAYDPRNAGGDLLTRKRAPIPTLLRQQLVNKGTTILPVPSRYPFPGVRQPNTATMLPPIAHRGMTSAGSSRNTLSGLSQKTKKPPVPGLIPPPAHAQSLSNLHLSGRNSGAGGARTPSSASETIIPDLVDLG